MNAARQAVLIWAVLLWWEATDRHDNLYIYAIKLALRM